MAGVNVSPTGQQEKKSHLEKDPFTVNDQENNDQDIEDLFSANLEKN
jgi:hypothetical protein